MSTRGEGDPFVDPVPSDDAMGDAPDTVACGRGVTLRLGAEGLVIVDENYTEESSLLCGLLPKKSVPTRSIPYFHVLSAEILSDGNITIRYAKAKSSSVFRATSISYPLEKPKASETQAWLSHLLDRAYGKAQRNKRIKVLINPFGGKGSAQKLYTRDVEPIFAAARCDIDVENTKYQGHAIKIAEELDCDKWDVVACCSGDGVPHEAFNGLGKRPDGKIALQKVAVVQLPCGSGNALSLNLNGTDSCSLAALCVVKGVRRSMDLASITQGDRRTLSFLSQSVGIVAESDLGTEHLRWMGDFRFTFGFLVRLFGKTVYPSDIAVCVELDGKDVIRNAYQQGLDKGLIPPDANKIVPSEGDDGLPKLEFGTINDPLPAGWDLVPHNTLGNFYSGNMAYMAPDANFFPASLPSDGCLDLMRIDGLVPRRVALQMLTALGNGALFGMDAVDYKKVKAYRIIPKDRQDGYISIDGERIPFEAFQVEVHRGLGTVLMRGDKGERGGYEAKGPA